MASPLLYCYCRCGCVRVSVGSHAAWLRRVHGLPALTVDYFAPSGIKCDAIKKRDGEIDADPDVADMFDNYCALQVLEHIRHADAQVNAWVDIELFVPTARLLSVVTPIVQSSPFFQVMEASVIDGIWGASSRDSAEGFSSRGGSDSSHSSHSADSFSSSSCCCDGCILGDRDATPVMRRSDALSPQHLDDVDITNELYAIDNYFSPIVPYSGVVVRRAVRR